MKIYSHSAAPAFEEHLVAIEEMSLIASGIDRLLFSMSKRSIFFLCWGKLSREKQAIYLHEPTSVKDVFYADVSFRKKLKGYAQLLATQLCLLLVNLIIVDNKKCQVRCRSNYLLPRGVEIRVARLPFSENIHLRSTGSEKFFLGVLGRIDKFRSLKGYNAASHPIVVCTSSQVEPTDKVLIHHACTPFSLDVKNDFFKLVSCVLCVSFFKNSQSGVVAEALWRGIPCFVSYLEPYSVYLPRYFVVDDFCELSTKLSDSQELELQVSKFKSYFDLDAYRREVRGEWRRI